MARFPGTEQQHNRAGWQPGQVVRCRRSRANAARELSDVRGFVLEVRPGHARLLLNLQGQTIWLEGEALLAESELTDPGLERFRQAYVLLAGQRLELDDQSWTVFSAGFSASALDQARSALGEFAGDLELEAHGVSEFAVRMSWCHGGVTNA